MLEVPGSIPIKVQVLLHLECTLIQEDNGMGCYDFTNFSRKTKFPNTSKSKFGLEKMYVQSKLQWIVQ